MANKDILIKLGICSIILLSWAFLFSLPVSAVISLTYNNRGANGIIPAGDILFASQTSGATPSQGSTEPWTTSPPIILGQPCKIGDTFVEVAYNSEAQTITQNIWEYRPELAIYEFPERLSPTLNIIYEDGWILKEQRLIENVTKVRHKLNGNIVVYKDGLPSIELPKDGVWENWDKIYSLSYSHEEYGKLTLRVKELSDKGEIERAILKLAKKKEEGESPRVVDGLIDSLAYVPDKTWRGQIIAQITSIGNEDDVKLAEYINNLLYHTDPVLRRNAAWVLGSDGLREDIRAMEPLIMALEYDEDAAVRWEVAVALGRRGNPAIMPLIKALRDESEIVRNGAAISLIEIGEPAVGPLIGALRDGVAAKWAIIALGKIREPAIEPLIKELRNFIESWGIIDLKFVNNVQSAIRIIGKPAVEPLIKELRDGEKIFGLNPFTIALSNLGPPAIKPLIEQIKIGRAIEEPKKALIWIGDLAFIPVIESLLYSKNMERQRLAKEIIQGIAKRKPDQETGIDPTIDISKMTSMGTEALENIASNNEHSITRAIALYCLGKGFKAEDFLRNYLFEDTPQGLVVKRGTINGITKLEMAAILNTGIPAQAGWWNKLANREERIKYIQLVLRGDFTDERAGVEGARAWVCVQYATQLVMNFNGYNEENFADREAFEKYGSGYIIPLVTYGIPIYYASTPGHVFNAVYVGDGEINNNIEDWIFIESTDDSFSPHILGDSVTVYLNPLFHPDGHFGGGDYQDAQTITIPTKGYRYLAFRITVEILK